MSTTHPSQTTGLSQADRILARLREDQGEWVSMPTLCHLSGSYNVHSRISDLRARGLTIEHKNERRDGILMSFYRLIESPIAHCPSPISDVQPSTFNVQPNLLL